MNRDGSGLRRLTREAHSLGVPSWSPDGTRIAFFNDRADGSHICIIGLSFEGEHCLTESGRDYQPSWSPAGQTIAFTSLRDGVPKPYAMNANGSKQGPLRNLVGIGPVWSPDGGSFALTNNGAIQVVNTDGSNPVRIARAMADTVYTWSPNGKKLAYHSYTLGGRSRIYVVNADGTNPVPLTSGETHDLHPSWSPHLTTK